MARAVGLSEEQLRLLGALKRLRALEGFYLGGGTAVAWYFGHRRSLDLDLFTTPSAGSLEGASRAVSRAVKTKTVAASDAALSLLAGGEALDLVRYPYAPLEAPAEGPGGFPVASVVDLGAMKLGALSKRGLKRDFWDLYIIVTKGGVPLPELLRAYAERYGASAADLYHVLRSLTYFEDAERADAHLAGLTREMWNEIRAWFEEQAAEAANLDLLRRRRTARQRPGRGKRRREKPKR